MEIKSLIGLDAIKNRKANNIWPLPYNKNKQNWKPLLLSRGKKPSTRLRVIDKLTSRLAIRQMYPNILLSISLDYCRFKIFSMILIKNLLFKI